MRDNEHEDGFICAPLRARPSQPENSVIMIRRSIPAILLLTAASTVAEARYACAVKRTPDGFVALREGPSANHAIAARMRPAEMVGLLHPPAYEDIVQRGNWLFVRWYPGTRRTAMHTPDVDESRARAGWVNRRLIDCFEE